MTIEQRLDELRKLEYPKQVDIVDAVMNEVSQRPYLQPKHKKAFWQRISAIAAVAAIAIVIINIAIFPPHNYDDEQLGTMIAQVNDYASYSSWGTIEEAALDQQMYFDE